MSHDCRKHFFVLTQFETIPLNSSRFTRVEQEKVPGTYGGMVGIKKCSFEVFSSSENTFPMPIFLFPHHEISIFSMVISENGLNRPNKPLKREFLALSVAFISLNMKQNNSLCTNMKNGMGV